LVRWNFFNENLFNSDKILTSKGIQRRYEEATKRRKNNECSLFWLLDDINVNINTQDSTINVNINAQSKVKESKVKESKVKYSKKKDSKVEETEVEEGLITEVEFDNFFNS